MNEGMVNKTQGGFNGVTSVQLNPSDIKVSKVEWTPRTVAES